MRLPVDHFGGWWFVRVVSDGEGSIEVKGNCFPDLVMTMNEVIPAESSAFQHFL